MEPKMIACESDLVAAALALGAEQVAGLSAPERRLLRTAKPIKRTAANTLKTMIRAGVDPLGDAFCQVRSAAQRRPQGATYTPLPIVKAMVDWAASLQAPSTVVDPGTGSARFLCAAGLKFPSTRLLGLEVDPLAALVARANLAAIGLASRSEVRLQDFRSAELPTDGRSLYIGNPPYVRHHQIPAEWKAWLVETAQAHRLKASQLAGLHAHFLLATATRAARGDFGAFITAAEWLDVNYGQLVRDLFLGPLGGTGIVVIEPTANPFPDAATTAAITTFGIGQRPKTISVRRIKSIDAISPLEGERRLGRERLEVESRWSRLTHTGRTCPEGYVELGELCRVHRGSVTGANAVWIDADGSSGVPLRYRFPAITRAKELIAAGKVLGASVPLKSVIDLPQDLEGLPRADRQAIDRFLRLAKSRGAHESYIARQRRAWWSVGLRAPAPILATYMARRPPSFVRNLADARHINIAHGLYPRQELTETQLLNLVEFLSTGVNVADGRTYAGGLTKFEPREMERLFVPSPALLAAGRAQ